ncbi:MAG TPA: hypothetical protein VNX25_00465, partial [Verrucomicrobiae bacterium]|nr:hypothetical protein [Verrucomicrobiae bacterium]
MKRLPRILLFLLPLLVVLAYCAALLYVGSSAAAVRVSRLATTSLGTEVRVERMALRGLTLRLHGLRVGTAGAPLLAVALVEAAPGAGVLRGRVELRSLLLRGLVLDLRKDPQGEWNVRSFASRLPKGKGGGGGGSIGLLQVQNAALNLQGRTFGNLTFTVRDLAATSAATSFSFAFADTAGNRARLQGKRDAAGGMEGVLDAPRFLLSDLAPLFPQALAASGGVLSVRVEGAYGEGKARAAGKMAFAGLHAVTPRGELPLSGELSFAGAYDGSSREISSERLDLSLWDGAAKGTLRGSFRGSSDFRLAAEGSLVLAELARKLPGGIPGGLSVDGGSLQLRGVRLARSAGRIVEGSGSATVSDFSVQRRGEPLLQAGAAKLTLLPDGG